MNTGAGIKRHQKPTRLRDVAGNTTLAPDSGADPPPKKREARSPAVHATVTNTRPLPGRLHSHLLWHLIVRRRQ
jgi:hypothetical protein